MWVEKKGKGFRIRDRVAGEIVTLESGFPTKTAARVAATLLTADALRGDALVPRGGKMTMNELLDLWWPSYARSLKETSATSEGARFRNHIRPLIGALTLDALDQNAVQLWVDNLSAGRGPVPEGAKWKRRPLAPKSVTNAHGMLFVVMRAAIGRKLIRVNPCAGTNLPQREHKEMRFLTDPEIARLVRALPPHWRPLILLLLATGLRWGEAIGLKAGRVDLLAKKPALRVVEQLQERGGRGSELYFSSPKSFRSRRTVTFTKQVALILTGLVAGKDRDAMVFLTTTGLMIRTRNFRRIWMKACEDAGLVGLRVHDLRHTHAAILLSSGRTMSVVSRRLGHASVAVTDMIYGHLREEADDGIDEAVDAALAGLGSDELMAEVEAELAAAA